MDLDFANYVMDRAINVADKFHFYEIKVDFLKDILWLFEHVTEHCKIENSIGYNAGIYYCEGIKMLLKFANKFKWTQLESKNYFESKKDDLIKEIVNFDEA